MVAKLGVAAAWAALMTFTWKRTQRLSGDVIIRVNTNTSIKTRKEKKIFILKMSFLVFFSRNIGYGCANSISRVGAMVAPQIVQLVRSF